MSTEKFELIAPCHFGLEAVLKREILDLGYEISQGGRRQVLPLSADAEANLPMPMYSCAPQSESF